MHKVASKFLELFEKCRYCISTVNTWIRLCLIIRFLHPFVRRARWCRRLRWPGARRAFSRAGQVPSRRRRHIRYLSLSRLSLRKLRIRHPFSSRRSPIPSTPLLLLEVLMLPAVPATAVLPALALVHGERIDVIHHASITVRASQIHSSQQHCSRADCRYSSRSVTTATE